MIPDSFELGYGFPNPFNADMLIPFALASDRSIEIAVYDLAGQQIQTLDAGPERAGRFLARWDGRNEVGAEVASAVYALHMAVGEFTSVGKVVVPVR